MEGHARRVIQLRIRSQFGDSRLPGHILYLRQKGGGHTRLLMRFGDCDALEEQHPHIFAPVGV